jgi:hypothetical protein
MKRIEKGGRKRDYKLRLTRTGSGEHARVKGQGGIVAEYPKRAILGNLPSTYKGPDQSMNIGKR